MRHALLIAQSFDRQDDRLSRIRAAIRDAGLAVTSLSFESDGEAMRDPETRELRPRAVGLLMLSSQIVIAIVIAGYFSRFYPLVMTIIFWTVILSGAFLASPMGVSIRNAVLARIGAWLGQLETAKTRFDVIWAVDPESLHLARQLAKRDSAKLIFHARKRCLDNAPDSDIQRDVSLAATGIDHWVADNTEIAALYAASFGALAPVILSKASDKHDVDAVTALVRD
jgi:hypothetical protein